MPALDAVMFLNLRKSIVDVEASRLSDALRSGKQYGYIIVPLGVPAAICAAGIGAIVAAALVLLHAEYERTT